MNVFEFGVLLYGGLVFGFDCLVVIMGGFDIICDYIVFLKNNSGCDVMIDVLFVIEEV